MLKKYAGLLFGLVILSACASGAPDRSDDSGWGGISLPDTIAYSQKDARWAGDRMGGSGATMEAEGCLVTAAAMALTNLGFKTSPGALNNQLKRQKGYTSSGLLIWSAIERVSGGGATARYYNDVNKQIIARCMADGFYPLARFILPNGRTHWSMIVRVSDRGYHMRDPLHPSRQPLIFAQGISGFKAVRCVGRKI